MNRRFGKNDVIFISFLAVFCIAVCVWVYKGAAVEGSNIVITVDGKEYLLEKPLKADVALIGANICDEVGNLVYKGTSQNFNPLMATAANVVIVEPQEIVKTGAIEHENVKTPGIFVDYIIKK